MKKLFAFLLIAIIAGCVKSPSPPQHFGFDVDQFIAVTMEYQGAHALIAADTYGPTTKEFDCSRSAEAAVAQSDNVLPAGHTMVTTCLHVKFGGPLPRGVALPIPIAGTPFEYLTVGVEYTAAGGFVGAQALHSAPDVRTCMAEARDVIASNYRDGTVPAGNSLLLYCMPVPTLDVKPQNEGGVI